MNLRCVISDPFKRENKRQCVAFRLLYQVPLLILPFRRVSELEHEANELRQKLEAQMPQTQQPTTPAASTDSSMQWKPTANSSSPNNQLPAASPPNPSVDHSGSQLSVHPREPTTAQSIDGAIFQPQLIDQLFQRYFQAFHQYLPILDKEVSPNEYHRQSEILFWSIIVTACRNFSAEPALLSSIGKQFLALALMSLRDVTIPTIKSFLIVLTWPLPRSAACGSDVTYAISGSLIHMAMEIGLHIPTSAQDFSRVKINLTKAEIAKRAELWGYCIVTYQRWV